MKQPLEEEKHLSLCTNYLSEQYPGIASSFEAGFLTVCAYSILDLLRFIINTHPVFIFSGEMKALSETLGFRLPESPQEMKAWTETYLHMETIFEDIKRQYLKF